MTDEQQQEGDRREGGAGLREERRSRSESPRAPRHDGKERAGGEEHEQPDYEAEEMDPEFYDTYGGDVREDERPEEAAEEERLADDANRDGGAAGSREAAAEQGGGGGGGGGQGSQRAAEGEKGGNKANDRARNGVPDRGRLPRDGAAGRPAAYPHVRRRAGSRERSPVGPPRLGRGPPPAFPGRRIPDARERAALAAARRSRSLSPPGRRYLGPPMPGMRGDGGMMMMGMGPPPGWGRLGPPPPAGMGMRLGPPPLMPPPPMHLSRPRSRSPPPAYRRMPPSPPGVGGRRPMYDAGPRGMYGPGPGPGPAARGPYPDERYGLPPGPPLRGMEPGMAPRRGPIGPYEPPPMADMRYPGQPSRRPASPPPPRAGYLPRSAGPGRSPSPPGRGRRDLPPHPAAYGLPGTLPPSPPYRRHRSRSRSPPLRSGAHGAPHPRAGWAPDRPAPMPAAEEQLRDRDRQRMGPGGRDVAGPQVRQPEREGPAGRREPVAAASDSRHPDQRPLRGGDVAPPAGAERAAGGAAGRWAQRVEAAAGDASRYRQTAPAAASGSASTSGHRAAQPSRREEAAAPPPAVAARGEDEESALWFYIDPQGVTQGPCSLRQFRGWLDYLSSSSEYKAEFAQFKSVEVWKTGMPTRLPLLTLLGQLEARAAR